MFRMKAKKSTMRIVRNSLREGSDMLTDRIAEGMKYTSRWAAGMGKNQVMMMLKDNVMKKPAGGLLAVAGLGLAIWGIVNLMRK